MHSFFNNIDESGLYSYFTRATPTPTLLMWEDSKRKEYKAALTKVTGLETTLSNRLTTPSANYKEWLATSPVIKPIAPVNHFTFDNAISNSISDLITSNQVRLDDEIRLVEGHSGKALHFSGDNQLNFNKTGDFHRWDEFSISIWLKPSEIQDRAIILHHSKAWTDSGSRGYELVLDHGKPFFGLIHFWPGNAIAIEAKSPLPTKQWSHIVLTYDGSSRASGMHVYINGTLAETSVLKDHLFRDIVHRGEWGDGDAGNMPLVLAGRFRDQGFKNGEMDDLRIFDKELTSLEISEVYSPHSSQTADAGQKAQYYFARVETNSMKMRDELKRSREQEYKLVDDTHEMMVMEEMPVRRVTHVLKRGAYDAPGAEVQPDVPNQILPLKSSLPKNRLGLAEWVVDRKNPLTARVAVNRIWKQHFGRGIVATPEDFGVQGRLPSHPELLDWLAAWFMDHQWDVKALHRLIVNSATFQQTSAGSTELVERDPDNHLLARGPKFRLMAEFVRDSALADSGLLNPAIGGKSVFPYQPAGLWEQSGTGQGYNQEHGDKLYRRSLYTFWRRTSPPPSMLTFDAVSREVCTARRENTSTPLQSLILLNDPQFIEASRVLGEKLLKEFPMDPAKRNEKAFHILVGRAPDSKEMDVLNKLYDEQKKLYATDEAEASKLLAVGEKKADPSLSKADFAATTLMVDAIINYDEFIFER